MRGSVYARAYALAQRLAAASPTPYDYVQQVRAYLRAGFTYTETPPARPVPLDGFLFDDRRGYCQQYSGAMALLLRMGGVPGARGHRLLARRSTTRRGEYVVRDFDAHSWVEVWFPGIGWVTFDPTPAAAPARSQPADATHRPARGARAARAGCRAAIAAHGAERPPRTTAGRRGGGRAGGRRAARRRAPRAGGRAAAVARGCRATRRSPSSSARCAAPAPRRPRRPRRCPRSSGASPHAPAAAGYVRALRDARYADPRPPDARAAPRPAPRAGRGAAACAAGCARWWALPPRSAAVAGRAPYTGSDGRRLRPLSARARRCSRPGDFHQATVPLAQGAGDLEPDKTSIREALGRALLPLAAATRTRAGEFEAVVDRAPTNDYALFCLGRSLCSSGRHDEARKPLALAAPGPDRRDYRIYRDRARRARTAERPTAEG